MKLVGSLTLTRFLRIDSAHWSSTTYAPGRECEKTSQAARGMYATMNDVPIDVVLRFNDQYQTQDALRLAELHLCKRLS